MSTKIQGYTQNGSPLLRPEHGIHERTYSKVSIAYHTDESAAEVLHRLATSGYLMDADISIETVSITEIKRISWSRAREIKSLARIAEGQTE